MMGHLTGAAGSVEAAAALLALTHNLAPPTINQEYPDPDCDLDYVPNVARPVTMQTVIANAFAFGGVNTVLVFRRLERDD
jgi:3-oxoacyl-[acyl-carrier-protein] synthase II